MDHDIQMPKGSQTGKAVPRFKLPHEFPVPMAVVCGVGSALMMAVILVIKNLN